MGRPYPACYERGKGQPKKEMEIGPQNPAVNLLYRLQQMMVVAPVDSEEDEAEKVTQESGEQVPQFIEIGPPRNHEAQNHDGDNDGKDVVAEGFHAGLAHLELRRDGCYAKNSFHSRRIHLATTPLITKGPPSMNSSAAS